MLTKAKVWLQAFLKTPLGHALEHAVTAAVATAVGLLITRWWTAHTLTMDDFRAAWVCFLSGAAFGIRTALRNYFKPPEDPTKLPVGGE